MKARTCVNGIISYRGKYLICRMPEDLGVFPGQWGIPGGGLESGETIEEGLQREIREEVGLEIGKIRPLYFADDRQVKLMGGGVRENVYMIYLVFECEALSAKVRLNEEFEEYVWVDLNKVLDYDLNEPTRVTFKRVIKQATNKDKLHDEWEANPKGKIDVGTICPHCARYNARNIVGNVMVWRKRTAKAQARAVLLIKRDTQPSKGWWAMPGGYLDWDETVEECAMRELAEETGISVEKVELFGVYSDPKKDTDGRQNVTHIYTVDVEDEGRAGEEVSEIGWFDPKALPEKVAFYHDELIEEYVKKAKS